MRLSTTSIKNLLKSQSMILKRGMNMKDLHDAFTEQGAAMLATILRSDRAIQINIEIMRTFVRLRQLLASHANLARKLRALERKYDGQFKVVFDALRELMKPPDLKNKRRIGFTSGLETVPGQRALWRLRSRHSTTHRGRYCFQKQIISHF